MSDILTMPTTQILQYLKTYGEKLDTEIADAVGISVVKTRGYLSELTEKGEVMSCHTIRFVKGKKLRGSVAGCQDLFPRLRRAGNRKSS